MGRGEATVTRQSLLAASGQILVAANTAGRRVLTVPARADRCRIFAISVSAIPLAVGISMRVFREGIGAEPMARSTLHDDGGVETRLTVELVPSTCWYTNVRSNVSKAVWDRPRRQVAADAGDRCEICGGRGRRWPVECHEVWGYDDRKVQRLDQLVALCAACHEVRHAGLASKRGRLHAVIGRLAEINGWSNADAALYLEGVFETWGARSRHEWTLDITVLRTRYDVTVHRMTADGDDPPQRGAR
jgi:hypothetical protein